MTWKEFSLALKFVAEKISSKKLEKESKIVWIVSASSFALLHSVLSWYILHIPLPLYGKMT